VWLKHPFDEKQLKSFHFYDLDFSINIHEKKDNYVIYDIILKHFSLGNINEQWISSAESFHQKWKNNLPVNQDQLSVETLKELNYLACVDFCNLCIQKKYYSPLFFKCIAYLIKSDGLSIAHLLLFGRFIKGKLKQVFR
ncbi:MAG: hypothetical protein ACOYKE_15190, partial [Ferruginibacter sp.]